MANQTTIEILRLPVPPESLESNQTTTDEILSPPTWSLEPNQVVKIDTSCSDESMVVFLHFEKPFRGLVFAKNFPHIEDCAVLVRVPLYAERVRLEIPHRHCGSHVRQTDSGEFEITNSFRIMHHPNIRTRYDATKQVSCVAANTWDYPPYEQMANVTMEVSSGSSLKQLNEEEDPLLDLNEAATYLVIRAPNNGSVYNDMVVRNCIAHDSDEADNTTTFCQVTDIYGCQESRILHSFFRLHTTPEELVMVSQFKDLGILSSTPSLFLTCGINLCKWTCDKGCGQPLHKKLNLFSHSTNMMIRFNASDFTPLAAGNRSIYSNCLRVHLWEPNPRPYLVITRTFP